MGAAFAPRKFADLSDVPAGNGVWAREAGVLVWKDPATLGGAPSGPAGGVLGGTYPNPAFAVDMATQAELDALKLDSLADMIVVAKAADETISSNNVLQNDDDLFFTIGASATEIWWFEIALAIVPANATMDFQCDFTAPAGATAIWGVANLAGVGSVNGWGVQNTAGSPSGLSTGLGPITVGTVASGTQGLELRGWIFGGGTGGTVQFRWAQNTSNPGTLTVTRGGLLRALKARA